MNVELYICMTSGIEGPKLQLTEEQSKKVLELVSQLTESWEGSKFAGRGLGPDRFMVAGWTEEESEIGLVRTEMSGYVGIQKHGEWEPTKYRDTVGLWAYLAPLASQAHVKWLEEIDEVAQQYPMPPHLGDK